jgi:Na+/H+ antiporter NhaC
MNRTVIKTAMALTVVVILSGIAIAVTPESPNSDGTAHHWYSILPPLLAISFAIITGRILFSLSFAVLVGGLLNTVPENPVSLVAWGKGIDQGMSFIGSSIGDSWNMQILAFVIFALTMIAVVIVSGGLHGIVLSLSRHAKGPRSAQMVTYLMGLVIFFDDYANTMIVGTAMRPVTDKMKVSREKLAFIVDATSAPIAGLAIISTWVGYEVSQFQGVADTLSIDRTGYAILFDALPFRFYCILMLAFVLMTIVSGKDFGPMRKAENRTRITGAVEEEDAVPMTSETYSRAEHNDTARISAWTGIIPIVSLIVILLGGIWIDGGGWAKLQENLFSIFSFFTWRDVISVSENSVKILAYGSAASLGVAIVCARLIAKVDHSIILPAIRSGAQSSMLPVIILLLAWSLKLACDSLGTGPFLVAAVGDSISPAIFPAVIFVIAGLTAFATGTSYGTMAILMPTAVPIAYALEGAANGVEGGMYGVITMITLGSILDGAILGDHCSPISDTTIMSSISSSSDHLHHVRTQLPYSLTVGAIAFGCGYLPSGFGAPPWVGYVLALIALILLFTFIPKSAHSGKIPADV